MLPDPRSRGPARLAALLLATAGAVHAQVSPEMCGPLQNAYGPVDFRTDKDKIGIVEGAHFTKQVENLIAGNASYLGGDIDYTLRAIPNHPRALIAMIRYGDKLKVTRVPHATYDVECYLERALRFRPNDTTARMLYADFLGRRSRRDEALRHLETARSHADDNPFTHYNIGLIYLELSAFEQARAQALKARELGFPRTDLIDRLKAANQWSEPAPASPASASSGP